MTEPSPLPDANPRPGLNFLAQWAILIGVSALLASAFHLAGLPAALLLGPMVAGILISCNGGTIRVRRPAILAAQSIVGCLIARAVTGDMLTAFAKDWPLLLGVVLVILATSSLLGWLLTKYKVLPGTTGVWGTAPGAASALMVMAGDYGADARLVAFMQYLRVMLVAALASVVARVWVGHGGGAPAMAWFPLLHWQSLLATLLTAGLGAAAGVALRVPAGALLFPMLAGAALEGADLITIDLPPWLLAMSYSLLGWGIGLSFTRAILSHATRALPQVLFSILVMILVSGALAVLLVRLAGIDPLTAYLATSPGGMDSVAIIGAASKVDLSFVMALQTLRFLIVLVAGPPLARFIAQRMVD